MAIDSLRSVLGSALSAALFLFPLCAAAGEDALVSDSLGQPAAHGSFAGVRGIVTDDAGHPMAEVGIAVTAASTPAPDMLMLTAPDGSYSWPLGAGTYSLTAHAPLEGYRPQTLEVAVPEGGTVELNFTLQRER